MGQEKILIADDDKDLLEGLNFLFRSEGYHVISATDGISALNLAQTQNPDLIILDLSLPWMDGYKVIECLISPVATSDIPIIVLTGRNASINQDRAIKAGAEAFFHKPFDNRELAAAVETILEERRMKKFRNNWNVKKIG
ncbi:MAG: response regulator [Deltaproteobacteria bacterium]|nr:response regulator [Deltaproteobacteria bacterium]